MTTPAARRSSRWLVRVATTALPAAHRGRYRQELTADLGQLPRREQLGFALRVLVHSLALRHALTAPAPALAGDVVVPEAPHRPFACRMHLYHRWKTFTTDDGHRYLACAKCGSEKEGSGDTIGYVFPAPF